MSSTLIINKQLFPKINSISIPFNNYNSIDIDNYNATDVSPNAFKGYNLHQKCSESPNIPNCPFGGNTPPDTNYIKLIYLNYLANTSLKKNNKL